MTQRLLLALALAAAALVVAAVLRRRRPVDAPARTIWPVPEQLDRADFSRPDAEWLVVVFSSATCTSCARVVQQARVLESAAVSVDDVEVGARRDLHTRYRIEAVPLVAIADTEGVVRASFVGPPTATDLWAAVAELRRPGSSPEPHLGRDPGPAG